MRANMTREQFYRWIAKPELPKVTAEEASQKAADAAAEGDWFNEWYWEGMAEAIEKEEA